jgi:hypothetical protein
MKNLRDCVGKIYGKIIAKEDADQLFRDVEALVQRGLTPIQAELQAVQDALDGATANGEKILNQIAQQRPQTADLAVKFWNRQTVRPQGTIEPVQAEPVSPAEVGAPAEVVAPVAPAPVIPHQEITDAHNFGPADQGGSTINAVHGDLGGREGNYSVSIFPEFTWVVPGRLITPEQVAEFEARLRAKGINPATPNLSIGTWYNPATNETQFDLAITTTNRERAIALGFQYNQIAIFDLGNFSDIPTGGTGEAVGGLPMVAERLASVAAWGETSIGERPTTTEAPGAGVQGRPATEGAAPPAEPAGAQPIHAGLNEVPPEAPSGPEAAAATSPDLVSPPLTDEQQAVVDSLPEGQRAAAQAAFQVDNRDLLADQQRKGGGTAKKRRSKPVAPEKNTKLLKDLSKYGAFDQDTSTVLDRIANDKTLPKWKRMIADLFNQLGLFDNIDIRVVNTPSATWKGLFVPTRTGRNQLLINLSHKNADVVGTIIHEIAHHGTKAILEAAEDTLTPAQIQAKRQLEKILDRVRGLSGFEAWQNHSLVEFVAEIFENEDLRALLDATKPDGKVSFMTQIRAVIGQLLGALGFKQSMRAGNLLDEAIGQAINIAGTAMASRDITPAALKERNARLAELANEFPAAQEALADLVAPVPMRAREYPGEVDVSETRKTGGYWIDRHGRIYDVDKLGLDHPKFAKKFLGMTAQQAALSGWTRVRMDLQGGIGTLYYQAGSLSNAQRRMLEDISSRHHVPIERDNIRGQAQGPVSVEPVTAAPQVEEAERTETDYDMSIHPEDVIRHEPDYEAAKESMQTPETKADLERLNAQIDELGPTVKATKQEIAGLKKYVAEYYEDARAEAPQSQGWVPAAKMVINKIQKLVRGKRGINPTIIWKDTPYTYAHDENGKPLSRFLKAKKGEPLVNNPAWGQRVGELTDKMVNNMEALASESGQMAATIRAQIKWYRDMVHHLRTTFGSLSDFAADILGGLSPQQGVGENWKQMVNFLEGVMKGKYDKVFGAFDRYMRGEADPRWNTPPEKRTATSWKTEMPELEWWPTKIDEKTGEPSGTKFSANTANIMMAGLDMWRKAQEGDAPKARNFGLNLIGQSIKATIDRWAGRYLQRMHSPNYRIPPLVEGEVKGEHMLGDNFNLVTSDFGLGQEVFEAAAERLARDMPEVYEGLTPADLQAILWFAEKRLWELNGWTYIRGAENSMMAMAETTKAQRYEAGAKPSKVSPSDKKTIAEIEELRGNINGEANVIGGKVAPTYTAYKGKQVKTFDADVIVHPEFNPTNSIGHLAKGLAKMGKDAGHIQRVILDPREDNPNAAPGLHIFFKTRATEAQVNEVIQALQKAGFDGVTASVDPRIRPEVIKSLDPNSGAAPYGGVRFNYIPQYGTTGITDPAKALEMINLVAGQLMESNANIADARVMKYDTLVLEKGTDYDTNGRLTEEFRTGRAAAWTQRALGAGHKATIRKLEIQRLVKQRNDANRDAKLRNEEELEKQRAAFRAHQDSLKAGSGSAIEGGVEPVAPQVEHADETEPIEAPERGRASLVQAMVKRLGNLGRDQGGLQLPESEAEVRGTPNLGRRTQPGRGGTPSVWRSLGVSFRRREAALYRKIDSAVELIRGDIPGADETSVGGQLIDYLTGKETPFNAETQKEINDLRREIPVVPVENFRKFKHLGAGQEANAFHDTENGIVYKIYQVDHEGDMHGGYAVGDMRLRSDGDIGISEGHRHTVPIFLKRMANTVAHEGLTPQELVAVTPNLQLVFAQPYIEGRETTKKSLKAALARAGVHFLSDKGAVSGVAQLPDGRWILYDDLHEQNVRTLPGGRVEIIDANNREMTQDEVDDLETLGKLRPPEKPTGVAPRAKRVKAYDNAIVVAPQVETHHGTPHEWEPEKRIRWSNGGVEWVPMDFEATPEHQEMGLTFKVIERAPAGRPRLDKVASGEGNAAFGWGVLYSAQRRDLAEHYRDTLIRRTGREGTWLLDGKKFDWTVMQDQYPREEFISLTRALADIEPDTSGLVDRDHLDSIIDDYRYKAAHYRNRVKEGSKSLAIEAFSRSAEEAENYQGMADALEKYRDRLEYRKAQGNVYTLRIDADDHELLDWFMPMKDQAWVVDKVLQQMGHTRESALAAEAENERLAEHANDLEIQVRVAKETAGDVTEAEARHAAAELAWADHHNKPEVRLGSFVRRMERAAETPYYSQFKGDAFYKALTSLAGSQQGASQMLDAAGVPGIVFLDRESRPLAKTKWQLLDAQGHVYRNFETREDAEKYLAEMTRMVGEIPGVKIVEGAKTFNNYVIFNPELIKVIGKNGEEVGTVADDLPAAEGPTVAAQEERDENVQDETDLTVAPMAARGSAAREPYQPAGFWGGIFRGRPHGGLSDEINRLLQLKKGKESAAVYKIDTMTRDFQKVLRKTYGKVVDPATLKQIMTALGNLDTRLTQAQADALKKIQSRATRDVQANNYHMQNVAAFKVQQQAALNALPDEVREEVNKLRAELDLESDEALKNTGLNTKVRARLTANQGVFLHGNAFKHFEDDLWRQHITSDHPEAVRIRAAAEVLFRNEIITENAIKYQQDQKALGNKVTDADAMAYARMAGVTDTQAKERLNAYLNKEADEPTRLHLLQGKMNVTRNEAGKMIMLDRENIPAEVRALWGQYDDPAMAFAKTLSILSAHNAQTRMEQQMLADGKANGYMWDRDDPARDPNAEDMATDKNSPLFGVKGPKALKEALAGLNERSARSLIAELNALPLMMKTVYSVASAVHNFFGNPMFMVTNGNLLLAARYFKGTANSMYLTVQRMADRMATSEGRKQLARMIELKVLDETVDAGILKDISKSAGWGHKWEKMAGFGASITAMQRSFLAVKKAGGALALPFKRVYTAADNFWRLANYNVELQRSKAINPGWSQEQHEERAADLTRKLMPTYSNIPDYARKMYTGLGGLGVAPYFAFQLEAARTYASAVHQSLWELGSDNPKERRSGTNRLMGILASATLPLAATIASKLLSGYDDKDEEAVRNGLPDYQKNNHLIFFPRAELTDPQKKAGQTKGNPRYMDLTFLNPYSLWHTTLTAGRREGFKGAGLQLAKPLFSLQPLLEAGRNIAFGRDTGSVADDIAKILKVYSPGIFDSGAHFAEAVRQKDLPFGLNKVYGEREERTGKPRVLTEEIMKVFPGAAMMTFDPNEAATRHISKFKKEDGAARKPLNDKLTNKGDIGGRGVITDTKLQSAKDAKAALAKMHTAYRQLLHLGMTDKEAIKQLAIGFGTEERQTGLAKKVLGQIMTGNFKDFDASRDALKDAAVNHPERYKEYFETRIPSESIAQ